MNIAPIGLICGFLTFAADAEPKIQVVVDLTGAAAAEAKAFAASSGDRYPFPATFRDFKKGFVIELGKEMQDPVPKQGKRFVGVILSVHAKLAEDRVAVDGGFFVVRFGAMKQAVVPGEPPNAFDEWIKNFKTSTELDKELVIDLSRDLSAPATLKLTFSLIP